MIANKWLTMAGIALFCLLMGSGQMLFKLASIRAQEQPNLLKLVGAVSLSPHFWAAGLLYGVASTLWVVILTRVPLNVAYPATSITLVLVAIASWIFFGEAMTMRIVAGMTAILIGVWLISTR